MADPISRVLYRSPISDQQGLITRPWQQFFEALLALVGGPGSSTTMGDITQALLDAEIAGNAAKLEVTRDAVDDVQLSALFRDVPTLLDDAFGNEDTMGLAVTYPPDEPDALSGERIRLPWNRHLVHEGLVFFHFGAENIATTGGTREWLVITPNTTTQAHFTFTVMASATVTVEFFEAPTTTALGSSRNARNLSRQSANTAATVLYAGPTITATGTRLIIYNVGDQRNDSDYGTGILGEGELMILAQDTVYLLRLTAAQDDTNVDVKLAWAEYTP